MRRAALSSGFFLFSCLFSCALASAMPGSPGEGRAALPRVWFNQHAIESAWTDFDAGDPAKVFGLVFSQLDDEVVIYPTENYYYFQFQARGKTYWGNLRLDALDRDQGVVHLGYFEFSESAIAKDIQGNGRAFTAADGLAMTKVDPWRYDLRYGGKTVRFRLNDVGFGPPERARLRPSETYVGPIFDESGLPFHLLYDRTNKRFLYVLDEDRPVAETFLPYDDRVVVGQRSGFAFFDDQRYSRKVLVAVNAVNANRNSYYDGPFDQLPDNYVERTQIKGLLEKVYPFARGQIDAFGHYLMSGGSERLAVFPYAVYTTMKELDFVGSCAKLSHGEDDLYPCLTPDFQAMTAAPRQPATVGEASIGGTVHD